MGKLVGLSEPQTATIIMLNDGLPNYYTGERHHAHSFAELAALIEGWFPD